MKQVRPEIGNRRASSWFDRLSALIVRARWPVLIAWVILIAALGVLFSAHASSALKGGGFDVPGSDAYRAATILQSDFHESPSTSVVLVFHSSHYTFDDSQFGDQVRSVLDRLGTRPYVNQVISYYTTLGPDFISSDRHTTFAIVALKGKAGEVDDLVPTVRDELRTVPLDHYVTGLPAINKDTFFVSEQDLQRAELFTFPVVLVLLLIVFRTVVAALIPLVLGAAAITASTAVVYLIGQLTPTSIFAINVSSLIGLGLAIDYSLIVISRYREERRARKKPHDALLATMRTAGRSIAYSGIVVILSMAVLTAVLWDLMIIRSISLAVALVALTAMLAATTLLPALLALLGDRLEWLRVIPRRAPRPASDPGFWYRFSHQIMRRPVLWLAAALVVLGLMAAPVRDLAMVGANPGVLPPNTESVKGAATIRAAFGASRLGPIQIVLKTHSQGGLWNSDALMTIRHLTDAIAADPRVSSVESISTQLGSVPDDRYVLSDPSIFVPLGPVLEQAAASHGPLPPLPGVIDQPLINARLDSIPSGPQFFGLGDITLPAGSGFDRRSAPGVEVISIDTGALDVDSDGGLSAGPPGLQQPYPSGPFRLAAGNELVVPTGTDVAIHATSDAPAHLYVLSLFVIRSTTAPQTSWTDGQPPLDIFAGISRQVLAGGNVASLSSAPQILALDKVTVQPGAKIPRHYHPGPEIFGSLSGTFTTFSTPEMTSTLPDGTARHNPYDTPVSQTLGSKTLVQAGGVHRAENRDTGDAVVLSARVYPADQPGYVPVAIREDALHDVNLDGANDAAVITVFPRFGLYDKRNEDLIYDLRQKVLPDMVDEKKYDLYVGGLAAEFLDFRDSLYGRFPLIVALVGLMVFAILLMFFQSIVLPLKAMALNVASILATLGLLVVVFQYGFASNLLGFKPQGLVNVVTPAVLYVVLFALSTDYEVLLLSRVREQYKILGDNQEAVAVGLQRTGGVITAAGLILVGTFGSFAAANIVTLKEVGLGLAIGVLLDSTVVRVVMVPATMRLLGRANWWMPAGLKRFVPELGEGEEAPPPDARLADLEPVPAREEVAAPSG